MPQVIPVATAIGAFLGFTGTAALVVGAIVIAGAVYVASKALMPDIPSFDTSASRGALLNKEGTTQPIPIVYGERRVGGSRIFMKTNGDKNRNLHMVMAVAEGPIQGFQKIWFNDELAATSSNNGATWTIASAFSGYLTVHSYNGDQTSADSTLVSQGLGWTNSHVGNGIAYVYLQMVYDVDNGEVYASGLPTVTFTIKGKKVPSIGSEYNQNLSYSNNPAHVVYDYLVNPNYGKGIPTSLIDATSFNNAAIYCAQSVTVDGSSVTRYQTNGYVNPDRRMFDNIVELLQAFRGFITASDKYQLYVDGPIDTSNALSINDDNIIGNIEFTTGSKKTLLNSIRVKYNNGEDANFNYQEDYLIVESSTLKANDGVDLSLEMTLPHTTNPKQCKVIATEEINQSRQSSSLQVTTTTALYDVSVADVVRFSNDTLGQTDKLYRVVHQVLTADHKMTFQLVEYSSAVYWSNNPDILINNHDDTDF